MSKKKAINFDLSEIADGGVQVKLPPRIATSCRQYP